MPTEQKIVDTVIKNGKVVKPWGIFSGGVGIRDEKIVVVASDENLPEAKKVIDARGNFIMPGVIDAHAHFAFPPGTDIVKAMPADTGPASVGGVTTRFNYLFVHGDQISEAKKYVSAIETDGYCDIGFNGICFTESEVADFSKCVQYGITAFKLLVPYRGAEAIPPLPGINDGIIYSAMEKVAEINRDGYHVYTKVHCENIEIFFKFKERFLAAKKEPDSWHDTRPNFVEAEAMMRMIYFAKVTGSPLYIVHMSIKEGVDIVRKARFEGQDVIAETCVQYLAFNVENVGRVTSKMNPPIRHREDNEALWRGIKEGDVSIVASDESQVPLAVKKDLWTGGLGSPSAAYILPVMLTEGASKGRISLEKVTEVCSYNPAKIHGIFPRKGVIEVGSDADLVIVDINRKVKITEETNPYQGCNVGYNPYDGWELIWPVHVFLRGREVAREGNIVTKAGIGRYIPGDVKS